MKMRRAHLGPGVPVLRRARVPWGRCSTGPQWGSAIYVLYRLLSAGRLALHPVTQKIGKDHVVPAAGWANFDDHDLKLPELVCHLFQFSGPLDPPGILPQLVAEHIMQVDQILGIAHRTIEARRLAMVLGRPDQHRVSVTSFLPGERPAGAPQRLEGGASLQRVVDDLTLGPHGLQRTWTRRRGRPCVIFCGIGSERELLARAERAAGARLKPSDHSASVAWSPQHLQLMPR